MHSELFTLLKSWIYAWTKVYKKIMWMYNSISVPKICPSGFVKAFGEFFLIVASCWCKRGGTPYMWFLPEERALLKQGMSSGKNVSKEVCLVVRERWPCSASWRTQHYVNSGCSLDFSGQQRSSKCVCWRRFYKQGPVRHWICASFETERWSGPSYNRSRSWFRTADGKWNGITCDHAQVFVIL